MGGLIQTKGTQRLAKWFNDVFLMTPRRALRWREE